MMISLTFTVDITEDGSVEMESDIDMRTACELTENIETVLNAVATSILEVHRAFHITDDVRKDIESLWWVIECERARYHIKSIYSVPTIIFFLWKITMETVMEFLKQLAVLNEI